MDRRSETPLLTPDLWQRMEAIFHAALERPASARESFLRDSCNGNDSLLQELRNLLYAFEDEQGTHLHVSNPERQGRAGETIGPYILDEEIGHGGMGTVYLAHRVDGEFEQSVALKLVSSHLRTVFFNERFRAERQILASLHHPNITRLLDGGVSSAGDPYLVMEYVDGKTIDEYCDERLLPLPDRIKLFLEACSAVEYAHRSLVVHRDLKPANFLVTNEGSARLLDFGTAKLLLAPGGNATTQFHVMTLRYASPEQCRGEPVSTSMDIYSLGVMLYELLAGAWPFGDPNSPIAGLERAVREIEPASPNLLVTAEAARLRSSTPAKLSTALDGDLRSVLLKAIESDPRRRYTSVEQLSNDLRRFLAGQPVLARQQTLFYRASRFVQRHRRAVAVATVSAAVAGISLVIAFQQYGRSQRRMVQVRNLSQSYLTGILNEVGKLPGSMKARLMIVDVAKRNLDELLPDAPRDPELRRALAAAYLQLGDIQGRPFTASLGDADGALQSYRKAYALASQASTKDWQMLAIVVRARRTSALIRARDEHYSEARNILNSTLEPAQRLWRQAPAAFQFEGKPAAALYADVNMTLGYVMLQAAGPTGSVPAYQAVLSQFRRTMTISEKIQAAHPGMPDMAAICSQYVGFTLEGLGHLSGDIRYFKESAESHQRSVDSACRIFERDPGQQNQRNCADTLGELSWALHQAGEGNAAVETASRALRLIAPVAISEPDSRELQQDFAGAYMRLGAAEDTAGKFHQALEHLKTAESMVRRLPGDPAHDPLQTNGLFVDIERELADALLASGDSRSAAATFTKALAIARVTPKSQYWVPYMERRLKIAAVGRPGSNSPRPTPLKP